MEDVREGKRTGACQCCENRKLVIVLFYVVLSADLACLPTGSAVGAAALAETQSS